MKAIPQAEITEDLGTNMCYGRRIPFCQLICADYPNWQNPQITRTGKTVFFYRNNMQGRRDLSYGSNLLLEAGRRQVTV